MNYQMSSEYKWSDHFDDILDTHYIKIEEDILRFDVDTVPIISLNN
jgi:hypothetical protein